MTRPQQDSAHVKLDAIVVVPPPAEGQTLVTERVCNAFEDALPFHLRAVRNSAALPGMVWRITKHVLLIAHLVIGALASRGRRRAYFVPDSNLGLWLNLLEAPLLRIGYRDVWLHHHVFRYIRHADWRMRMFLRILGPKTHHIVLGDAMANGLRDHYGAAQFHVLGNAAFVEDVPPAKRRTALKTIGFLSNITPEKGIGLFMETLRGVQARDPEIACVIAGPIKDPALKAQVEAFCAELPDKRTWLGPVYAAEKSSFFNSIDVLLFPSQYDNEALPVTICEALASGAPVLATDRGCIPDQLAGTGWVFAEDAFSVSAQGQISNWRSDVLSFARASESAAGRYTSQSDADVKALHTLTERLAMI